MNADDYTYWRKALAGERVPMQEGDPQPGFYRLRQSKGGPWLPVAIWLDQPKNEDGEPDGDESTVIKVNTQIVSASWVWMSCAGNPVSYKAYQHFIERGCWPSTDSNGKWTVRTVQIEDFEKAAAAFSDTDEIKQLVRELATRAARAGRKSIPGCKIIQEDMS